LTRTGIAGFVHADEFDHVGWIARLCAHGAQDHEASLPSALVLYQTVHNKGSEFWFDQSITGR